MALRWGILSAGKICNDFVAAMVDSLDRKEHQIIGVAARNLKSAQDFATTYNIPNAYGSYEELVKNPDIDVCYIGAINPTHLALVKLAMDHGKHVLCEKPLAMNVRETKEIIAYSKKKNLFLMEAIWSRFFPSYIKLKEEIQKGTIGDLTQVIASFGVPIADVNRLKLKELGGGSILDIGIYCIQFALYAFGGEKPLKIIAGGHMNSEGVDDSTSTTLIFSKGRTATLVTNTKVELENEACAFGTKGLLKLKSQFWCSTTLVTPTETLEFELPKTNGKYNFGNSVGLSYQCNEVRRCIKSGLIESPVVSHNETLLIAEIMESVRKQIGVVYPQDNE